MAWERRTRPVTVDDLDGGATTPRLEAGGGPDGRAPSVSLWRKKKKDAGELGRRRGELSQRGPLARERGRGLRPG
jgi:hypothetical protein